MRPTLPRSLFLTVAGLNCLRQEPIRIQATVSGTTTGVQANARVVLYAKTNAYYIQPCVTEPRHALRNGRFGPIDLHTGGIFVLLSAPDYVSKPPLAALPAVDGKTIMALAGPFGPAGAECDVARCPAQ